MSAYKDETTNYEVRTAQDLKKPIQPENSHIAC
jgi:hypothetical protein